MFPALVGMNRSLMISTSLGAYVPRTRGDEPDWAKTKPNALNMFPALVGMNRKTA